MADPTEKTSEPVQYPDCASRKNFPEPPPAAPVAEEEEEEEEEEPE